ncbi:hydroxyisourate hydrolase [Actinoplanes sp. NPDC023801]|uniref:hydroxyisourate hydrolase n=1 Tax=Actinoplanes sp. NPDC023801 TaxID=3154595 RepID=UPI0033D19C2E
MRISAQAVDVVYGRPAAGVHVRIDRKAPGVTGDSGEWATIARAETDNAGVVDLEDWSADRLDAGPYRIVFDSDSYFATLGLSAAYKEVSAVVRLTEGSGGCRIEVRLAPYSYSMFFGLRG